MKNAEKWSPRHLANADDTEQVVQAGWCVFVLDCDEEHASKETRPLPVKRIGLVRFVGRAQIDQSKPTNRPATPDTHGR